MKLSRKSKVVLVLLMVAASACFAQKWKSLVKGIEGRVGGKNNSQQTTESAGKEDMPNLPGFNTNVDTGPRNIKNYKSKRPAKIPNEPYLQEMAKKNDNAENALKKEDFKRAYELFNTPIKAKATEKIYDDYDGYMAMMDWERDLSSWIHSFYEDPNYQGEK